MGCASSWASHFFDGSTISVFVPGESAYVAGPGSFPLLTPDKPVLPPPVVGQRTDDGDVDSTDATQNRPPASLPEVVGGKATDAVRSGPTAGLPKRPGPTATMLSMRRALSSCRRRYTLLETKPGGV